MFKMDKTTQLLLAVQIIFYIATPPFWPPFFWKAASSRESHSHGLCPWFQKALQKHQPRKALRLSSYPHHAEDHIQLSRSRQPGSGRVRCPGHHDVLHGHRLRDEHRRSRGHRRNRGLDSQQLPEGKGEGCLCGGRPG